MSSGARGVPGVCSHSFPNAWPTSIKPPGKCPEEVLSPTVASVDPSTEIPFSLLCMDADTQRGLLKLRSEDSLATVSTAENDYFRAAIHGFAIGMMDLQSFSVSKINGDSTTFSTQNSYIMHSLQGQGNSSELCGKTSSICMNYGSNSFFIAATDKDDPSFPPAQAPTANGLECEILNTTSLLQDRGSRAAAGSDIETLMDFDALQRSFSCHSSESSERIAGSRKESVAPGISAPQDPESEREGGSSPAALETHDSGSVLEQNSLPLSAVPFPGSVTSFNSISSQHHLVSITTSLTATGSSFLVIQSSSPLSSGTSLTLISLSFQNPSEKLFSFPRALRAADCKALTPRSSSFNDAAQEYFSADSRKGTGKERKRLNKYHDPNRAAMEPSDYTPIVRILKTKKGQLNLLKPSFSARSIDSASSPERRSSNFSSPVLSTLTSFELSDERKGR